MDVNLNRITHHLFTVMPAAPVVQQQKQPDTVAAAKHDQEAHKAEDKRKGIEALPASGNHLEFSVDNVTETMVVKVVDGENGEVVGQIPSETALRLRAYLRNLNT